MRYLQLEKHLIPTLNILRVEREFEDDENDETIQYETVYIHMKDGTSVLVEEETFDDICSLLNPIPK